MSEVFSFSNHEKVKHVTEPHTTDPDKTNLLISSSDCFLSLSCISVRNILRIMHEKTSVNILKQHSLVKMDPLHIDAIIKKIGTYEHILNNHIEIRI